MAKKPPRNYSTAALDPTGDPPTVSPPQGVITGRRGRPSLGATLKDVAKPVQLYLNPVGLKAIKRFALEENTKVHTLLIEAIEVWAKSKGLNEPIRVSRAPESD